MRRMRSEAEVLEKIQELHGRSKDASGNLIEKIVDRTILLVKVASLEWTLGGAEEL